MGREGLLNKTCPCSNQMRQGSYQSGFAETKDWPRSKGLPVYPHLQMQCHQDAEFGCLPNSFAKLNLIWFYSFFFTMPPYLQLLFLSHVHLVLILSSYCCPSAIALTTSCPLSMDSLPDLGPHLLTQTLLLSLTFPAVTFSFSCFQQPASGSNQPQLLSVFISHKTNFLTATILPKFEAREIFNDSLAYASF